LCADLRSARVHPDVTMTEVAAPSRVAPYALALVAEIGVGVGGDPPASGRLVVLHDPAGQDGWDGTTRLVAYVRADLDDEMTRDPLLAEVAWSWLTDALVDHEAAARALSGTVTSTASRRFGGDAEPLALGSSAGRELGELEVRCSWTPEEPVPITAHLGAFCALLAHAGGVPPAAPGVTSLRRR